MKTRDFAGIFAPMYQLAAFGNSVVDGNFIYMRGPASTASGLGSIVWAPLWPCIWVRQSAIHSTCCSIARDDVA